MLEQEPEIAMPGTCKFGSEIEFCEQQGLELCYREVLENPKDPEHWPWERSYLIDLADNRQESRPDDTACLGSQRWEERENVSTLDDFNCLPSNSKRIGRMFS